MKTDRFIIVETILGVAWVALFILCGVLLSSGIGITIVKFLSSVLPISFLVNKKLAFVIMIIAAIIYVYIAFRFDILTRGDNMISKFLDS